MTVIRQAVGHFMMLHRVGIRTIYSSLHPRVPLTLTRYSRPEFRAFSSLISVSRPPTYPSLTSPRLITHSNYKHDGVLKILKTPVPRINYRSLHSGPPPFKTVRISPIFGILAFLGSISLLFIVVPFVFTFFFPLIIAGVAVFQFKKWKSATLMQQLHRRLLTSKMRIDRHTILGLQARMFESLLGSEQNSAMFFRRAMDDMSARQMDNTSFKSGADDMISFLDSRILEAFKSNEQGIRDYFLGADVKTWVENGYELSLDSDSPRTIGKSIEGTFVMTITYPLYLLSSNQRKKLLADVTVAVLGDSTPGKPSPFFLMQENFADNKDCPMVISIKPARALNTNQFILDETDDNGNHPSRYTVKTTSDGHREFRYRG